MANIKKGENLVVPQPKHFHNVYLLWFFKP